MDTLFSLAPYAILLIVLYFGWNALAPRLKLRVPSLTADDLATRFLGQKYATQKIERQAAKEMKAGNYLMAGKIYEDAGMPQAAVDAYLQGDEFMAAGFVLEAMPGKGEKAAEYFLRAGDYKKSAEVFTTIGKPGKAAPLFEERGNNLEAARLYSLAQQWDKAAALFAKSGYPLRAGEAFEKKGDFLAAAEAYEKHFLENVTFSTTYSGAPPASETRNALKAGQLFEKAGAPDRAREVYLRGSFFKEAALVSITLGEFEKAGEYFLRAEDLGAAADAFDKGGDPVRAANYRGELAFKASKPAEAAVFFQKGQDYQRAAELFEQVGMLKEAAGAYEAGDSHASAGHVYLRAGLKDRAAACFEKCGEYETAATLYEEVSNGVKAAELYERAGLTFKSGLTAAQAGQTQKAIALLQRVAAGDEHYLDATARLAELFVQVGMTGLAIERLHKVLGGKPVAADSLSLYYWLALAHEAAKDAQQALPIYKRILAEDFNFRDVAARVKGLEAGEPLPLPAPPRPAASAPAQPAPAVAQPAPAVTKPAPAKPPRFVLKDEIARGPLGVLHRGEDSADNGKLVAMRVLPAAAASLLPAVMADLKSAAGLAHPNLVRVLGALDVDGQRVVVTELVQGTSLATALKAGQRLPPAQVLGIARALAQVLVLVHGKGLAHGSIQPSNVMSAGGTLKVADLGLGRLHLALVPSTPFRAPEGQLDPAADVYSFAALLHQVALGAPPAGAVGAPLPAPLDALVPRCLSAQPAARPTAAEIAARLAAKP